MGRPLRSHQGLGAGDRLRRWLCAGVGAVLLGAVLAPALHAAWTTPSFVSGAGQAAADPEVAVDADGNAVLTWLRFDGENFRVEARTRSAAGALGPVQILSRAGESASTPQVAINADGDAAFTWQRSDGTDLRIQGRTRSAAGALGAVQTLSPQDVDGYFPAVAVDNEGDAVFTWQRDDGFEYRIQARALSAAGALSGLQTISGNQSYNAQVAVDANDNAIFIWEHYDFSDFRIQIRTRSAAGALGAIQPVSAAGQSADTPQVALDATGDAVFAWRRYDGTKYRIQTRPRSAAGALGAVQTLSAAGQNARSPELAVDAGGDALVTWYRSDGTNDRVQARARSAAGALSATQNVSAAGHDAYAPQVGIDAAGNAVLSWLLGSGTNDRVQARAHSAAGVLGPVRTLTPPGASSLRGAVGSGGEAVLAWQRPDGNNTPRILASAGP